MIKITPFDFEFDGIIGDLFPNLNSVLSSQGMRRDLLSPLLLSVQNRLRHPSLKFPPAEPVSIDEISTKVAELNQTVYEKVNQTNVGPSSYELKNHIQTRFGIADFIIERDFEWLQRKTLEESFGDLSNKLVGEVAKDNAVEFFSRVVSPQNSIIQLVAWSACDFDLAHQIRSIEKAIKNHEKRSQLNSQAYKILGWIEALNNLVNANQKGLPTELLKNPLTDAMFAIKNATAFEVEKINRFGTSWPEERIQKAYLNSGSNIETIYFNWAISVMRSVLVWAGLSKKEAMKKIEDLYGLIGVTFSWENRMWNTDGGVAKPSMPNPSHIYYQYRTLNSLFEATNLA